MTDKKKRAAQYVRRRLGGAIYWTIMSIKNQKIRWEKSMVIKGMKACIIAAIVLFTLGMIGCLGYASDKGFLQLDNNTLSVFAPDINEDVVLLKVGADENGCFEVKAYTVTLING